MKFATKPVTTELRGGKGENKASTKSAEFFRTGAVLPA